MRRWCAPSKIARFGCWCRRRRDSCHRRTELRPGMMSLPAGFCSRILLLRAIMDQARGTEIGGDGGEDTTQRGDRLAGHASTGGAALMVVGIEVLGSGGHRRHGGAGRDVGI